jgi:hypothetical protein
MMDEALFSFIGADPQSDRISGCAALDEHGFVLTDRSLTAELLDERRDALGRPPLPLATSHPGLFAVGDLRSGSTKRVSTAVGGGRLRSEPSATTWPLGTFPSPPERARYIRCISRVPVHEMVHHPVARLRLEGLAKQ